MAWTYIVQCRDGSYYVGSTTNLAARVAEHACGDLPGLAAKKSPGGG